MHWELERSSQSSTVCRHGQSSESKMRSQCSLRLLISRLSAIVAVSGVCIFSSWTLLSRNLWFDETQAWLIARASRNPIRLSSAVRFEGRFPLWHLMIWPIARATGNPDHLKYFTLLLVGVVFFVIATTTRTFPAAIAVVSNPVLLLGYTALARDYTLLLLFAVILAAKYRLQPGRGSCLLVCLLALTNVFGALLAIAVVLSWIALWSSKALLVSRQALSLLVPVTVALAVSAWFISPKEGSAVNPQIDGLRPAIRRLVLFFSENGWMTAAISAKTPRDPVTWLGVSLIALSILITATAIHSASRGLRTFFVGGLAIVSMYFLLGYAVNWWHFGVLHCVSAMTLLSIRPSNPAPRRHSLALLGLALLNVVLFGLGPTRHFLLGEQPHSRARSAADFIRITCTESCAVVANSDLIGAPISAYLGGRSLYYVNRKEFGTYAVHTRSNWSTEPSWNAIVRAARTVEASLIVVEKGDLDEFPSTVLDRIAVFEGARTNGENYRIFKFRSP